MARLGILLTFHHYPSCSGGIDTLDPTLVRLIESAGVPVSSVSVYDLTVEGAVPNANACDAWLVSGAPAWWDLGADDRYPALLAMLRTADATGAALFGLYHGEHILCDALSAPAPQGSRRLVTLTRNPLLRLGKDKLYNAGTGGVREVTDRATPAKTGWLAGLLNAA